MGLSPRVRGNLRDALLQLHSSRSIPAGAGEPVSRRAPGTSTRVYPRGCGGTDIVCPRQDGMQGLSPRVRGNHQAVDVGTDTHGSIPAGAGEPYAAASHGLTIRVYPRGCGGTHYAARGLWRTPGLSPRVRGNHHDPRRRAAHLWSIPAGAGEPLTDVHVISLTRVYPRGCGGTGPIASRWEERGGLSPRVRGNRGSGRAHHRRLGSIPAGAGEPRSTMPPRPRPGVYPRGCGGTDRRPRSPGST